MKDLFRFEHAQISGPIRVLAFSCEEALGRPYALHVHADIPAAVADFEGALGKPGTLHFADTVVEGSLFGVELVLALPERSIYRLFLAPPLHALSMGHHSRVFVEKSVPDILDEVLRENGITTHEMRLGGKYDKRRHVCQYRETDLAFLHRWMEREGIYYWFSQGDDGAKLVICDDKDRHDDAEVASVRYFPAGEGDGLSGERFVSWSRAHAAVTAGVDLADYDHRKPAARIHGKKDGAALGFETLVRFEDNLFDQAESDRLAGVRAEQLACAQVLFRGRGRARGMHAGLRFALEQHPRDAWNQSYQIVRAVHRGSELADDPALRQRLGLVDATDHYRLDVEVLPASVQYRPERRTPWPEVHGVESAVVDGPADSQYSQIDDEGRYKVRLKLDEAKNPEGGASAWIRMAQPHGGSPEGHHFPLRKGTEVLLGFVHGDPDRPFLLGAAPTRTTQSPVTRANHTKNVIQTGGLSRMEIEDQEGRQYIDVSTPPQSTFVHLGAHAGLGDHNIVVSTAGDGLHNAGGNRDVTVGGAQTEDVKGNLVEQYASNQTTHVEGSFTETVHGGETQTISAGSTRSIDGGLTQTIAGGETRTVTGGLTETISGGRTQDITGGTTETITGSLTQTVSGAVDITTPATYTLTAAGGITMMTPGAGKVEGIGGVKLVAPAGQMTVDSEYDAIGNANILSYFLKVTVGVYRLAVTLSWYRKQAVHLALLGLKVDVKGFDAKKVTDDKKYGALSMIPAPATVEQNTEKQL